MPPGALPRHMCIARVTPRRALEDHAVELGIGDQLVRHVVPVLLECGAVAGVDVPLA
jgi:hypothetical protein